MSDGTLAGRAAAAWERFWYTPTAPVNLAAARIVFAAHALWILLSRDMAALSDLPEPFWENVSIAARLRFLIFEGHPGLETILQTTAAVALAAAIAGVLPRIACFVSGILLYHLAPLETIIWTPSPHVRGLTIDVLALLVLSFSRCGDALCVTRRRAREAEPGWEYAWALKLTWIFVTQIYFFSGYAKVFRVGWEWGTAANLRAWLLVFSQQDQAVVFNQLGRWLADQRGLCAAITAGALALELAFPLVLFSKTVRKIFVPAAAIGHAGILLALNLAFLNVPQLLIFLDWAWLGRRLGRSVRS